MPVIYGGHFEYQTRYSQMVELKEINIFRDSIDKECTNAINTAYTAYKAQMSQYSEMPEYLKIVQCIEQMIILKTLLSRKSG